MSLKKLMLQRMQELDVSPKRSLGQNFLVSEHVVEKIINSVIGFQPQAIIEIGPGLGVLTDHLEKISSSLTLIELDHRLANYHRGLGRSVHEADALRFDFNSLDGSGSRVLVSNLPYQIASSIVIERSIDTRPVDAMVLMFQKEVAQRISARLKDGEYGMLSVIASTFWKIQFILEAGTRDFWPSPKVASRVLSFEYKKDSPIRQPVQYLKFVKSAFLHPRKILFNNLLAANCNSDRLTEIWRRHEIDSKARPQELDTNKYIQIFLELG